MLGSQAERQAAWNDPHGAWWMRVIWAGSENGVDRKQKKVLAGAFTGCALSRRLPPLIKPHHIVALVLPQRPALLVVQHQALCSRQRAQVAL